LIKIAICKNRTAKKGLAEQCLQGSNTVWEALIQGAVWWCATTRLFGSKALNVLVKVSNQREQPEQHRRSQNTKPKQPHPKKSNGFRAALRCMSIVSIGGVDASF